MLKGCARANPYSEIPNDGMSTFMKSCERAFRNQ